MAVSSVLAPNGKTYTFEHPDGASQEDLFRFVHQSSQVKPKAQATKPGVVENIARSIPAGAARTGYDVLGAIGTMALEGLGKYAKAGSDPEYAEKMDQAVRGAQEKVSEYTFDIGATANESFGVDQGRFSADVGGGLGQLPVMILTGGLASVPMSFAEVIKDAEQSLDVKYYDMTEDQKSKVAATGGAYAAFSLAADRIGLEYMGLTKLNKFFDGSETVKGSIVKDVLKGTLGEGLTETSQAVVGDQLARVYDDDREYNIDSVKGYLYEGAVGATVGGIASTGTSVVKNIGSETSGTKKSDLKKEVEDRPALEVPRTVQVEYKELDGQVRVFPLAVIEGQDPMAAAEEALAGRYDPAFGLTVTDRAQPVGPEQELDLPDQAPDATQEEVPVQPEAAVPTPEQAPVEQVLPEVVPQVVPATEQAPVEPETAVSEGIGPYDDSELTEPNSITGNVQTLNEIFDLGKKTWENTSGDPRRAQGTSNTIGKNFGEKAKEAHMRGWKSSMEAELKERQARKAPTPEQAPEARSFSLPQNLSKTAKPKYQQSGDIKFASDLERAVYSATTSTSSDPAKRKRTKYRKLLQDAGYSTTEINAMGREVRSQMRDQYDGAGSELFVALPQDVVAEAAPAMPSAGSVNLTQKEIQFFDSFLGNKANREELLEEVPSLRISEGRLSIDPSDVNNLNNFVSDVGVSDGLGTVPPRLKTSQFYKPFFTSVGPDVVAEAAPLKAKAKKAKKVTRDYDLLSSPFISNYSGPGPTDTSVPDYGSFHYVVSNPQQQELNAAIASGAVDNLADQVANEAAAMMNDPAIAAGIGWYGRMRQRLSQIFGNDLSIFTQLLGTTSAQTPVETNFRFSVDLYNRFKAGEFDANIKEYLKLYGQMKAGTLGDLLLKDKVKNSKGVLYTPEMIKKSEPSALLSSAAEHYNLEPTQTSGKKYGTNSYPALKALAQVWFNERLSKDKMTPKTPQFTMNLNGESLEATIDVWAARLLRRVIYAGQADSRILPSQETAVNNPDFALGQLVFRRAAQKLNMNPDDLQALVWFGEKQIWDRNGWTGAAGALKSSFDEPADVFYPVDGSTRSEADANLILDFLAKERLVKRDIEFPDAVAKTRQNENRKEYDKFLRQRVISDYLKSRGSGAVYESSSVESNRKRQVTRSINRLSSYAGKVSYKKGTGKEPKGSLKVVKRGPVLGENRFARIAKANKDGNKFGSSVDVFKASDYKGYDLIITSSERGESVTIAISPDGELSSVTKSSNATAQDVDAAFDMAISTGKVKFLNGFETILPDKYASYGFTPVARLKFDPEFQPDGWSTQTYRNFNGGQPDVVFMRFDGTIGSEYDGTGFPEVDTYEEGVRLANQEDVTAQAAQPEVEDRGPQDTFDNGGQVMDFVESTFDAVADKIGIAIRPAMGVNYVARYNATQQVIEYNPMALLNRSKSGVKAAMREEIIHAAMHNVLMQQQRKTGRSRNPGDVWVDFFETFAKTLTAQERVDIGDVYQSLTTYHALGAEYSRAVVQNLLYGEFSEQYQMESKGGPAWDAIVQLLRSVQAYMAKVLGPMRKTNPEAAQLIVDSVELLKAADPSIRPKNQDVVAQAYDATDKNTAKENTEAGERVGQDASDRVRDERKWFESEIFQRDKISKALTPVVTRLRRINVKFARLFSKLDEKIRFRNLKYRKQSVNFFNKLNAIKGNEFLELKQLIFFSPTPQEADSFTSKNRIQRRDALLHKHGLLNMYRLDVQPILEELYIEYNKSGMPDMGYLEDYFPHVINDLNGLIKSYGHKTKRTFEVLVRDENLRRSKITDKNGDPAGLPEMDSEERARFFQDFLQNKLRKDLNGVNIPANAKGRSIALIPEDKLKFYDDPGQAFGKYTSSMVTALENYKVIGSTNKSGELGELGQLTEDLFNQGLIDQADVDQLKSLTELATVQFSKENPIFRLAGVFTYASTLIDVGTVAVQVLDLYKVLMQRGPSAMLKGVYRTVTGNREYDLERDFGFSEKQIMAEFDDHGFGDKALAFGLRYIVPFQQMDAAMKHSSVEAALIDFLRKAKSDVGSKKYNQLVDELTITLGREDAMKAVTAFRLDRYKDSPEAKAALLEELLQRQPMTYLQVPETYRRNPGSRLFYKLKTFMLLDINFNREMALNDLLGPEKTLKQRTKALKILTSMALALAAIGMPKDMLMDWIRGKDTYLPDHVANALLGIFGLNKYALKTVFESGPIDAVADRFTPAAYNIFDNIEDDLMSWVNGNKEISEFQMWANAPLFDVWGRFTDKFKNQQERIRGEKRKKGQRPTIQRF